jgi:phosphoenolpyruvate phosphomutase
MHRTGTTTRAGRLRQLLMQPELAFLMEAHNGISAKIVEETGFDGIWASGLTMSASSGVRDNNELSWTQVADQAAFMADAATIPVLLDGDTGYGNFNNVRRLVRRLEQIGVAGVAIEDKRFPKTNSFLRSERQPLADIDEFCGKIKAGKDSQQDDDFVIVARVEALIAGWGIAEAVRRAEAYRQAGADAIIIHSQQPVPTEIFAFLAEWAARSPIVLIPTKYYTTPTVDFEQRKVNLVIWANHLLRASITAMRQTAERIRQDESLINVEPDVAPLQEVFRLQGDRELEAAEAQYLPAPTALGAIVLAAGAAGDFGELTHDAPKTMLRVKGQPILARLLGDLATFGCRSATVVRGYAASAVTVAGANYIDNPDFLDTSEAYSLSLAEAALGGPAIVSFGDIVIKRHVIHALLEEPDEGIAILVDSDLAHSAQPNGVRCDRPYSGRFELNPVSLVEIDTVPADANHGIWIGMMYVGAKGAEWLRDAIAQSRADGTLRKARICHLLTRVMAAGSPVRVVYTHGGWINVNNLGDLLDAAAL